MEQFIGNFCVDIKHSPTCKKLTEADIVRKKAKEQRQRVAVHQAGVLNFKNMIKTVIEGASIIDMMILVIDINNGTMKNIQGDRTCALGTYDG